LNPINGVVIMDCTPSSREVVDVRPVSVTLGTVISFLRVEISREDERTSTAVTPALWWYGSVVYAVIAIRTDPRKSKFRHQVAVTVLTGESLLSFSMPWTVGIGTLRRDIIIQFQPSTAVVAVAS
jgi:hypothetical protein